MSKIKNLQFYKELMPSHLTMEIHRTDEGFWAKIKELPHCYTQANNFFGLIEMVNDAIYTYLEIPDKFRKEAGFYLPEEICDELRKKEWEKMFKGLSERSNLKEGKATLQMCLNV